jgi:hypothetical protein
MADPRRTSERELHSYVADLLRLTARRDVLWLHIPNESPRSPRYGAQLVRMGMLPGAADLIVVVRGTAHFLELKTAKGRLSPEQWAFREAAVAAGAVYEVARTPEQAKATLASWGALRPDSVGDIVRRICGQEGWAA